MSKKKKAPMIEEPILETPMVEETMLGGATNDTRTQKVTFPHSTTTTQRPTALENGRIAMNNADGYVFVKKGTSVATIRDEEGTKLLVKEVFDDTSASGIKFKINCGEF